MKKYPVLLKKLTEQKGFTLVEVMVVIVIIGILVSITVSQFSKQANKAKTARAEAELKSMATIISIYYAEKNVYPTADTNTTTGIETVMKNNGIKWDSTGATFNDPWGHAYRYYAGTSSATNTTFTLVSPGSDNQLNTDDDIVVSGDTTGITNPEVKKTGTPSGSFWGSSTATTLTT